jgi:acyl-CoA thioester hydrolase
VRVYWEDTDGGGIVYYASYLRYLERARTEWLRSLGYSQSALASDAGIVFTVVSLAIDYRRPARLDDALIVMCEPCIAGPASLRFLQQIHREGATGPELLIEASVRVACVDARTLRPRRLPSPLARTLQ